MKLEEAKKIVKEFVSHWTDQKLCEVLAFCEDGKMRYYSWCGCLLGVASSRVLHTFCYDPVHYIDYKRNYLGAAIAERAYFHMAGDAKAIPGFLSSATDIWHQKERDVNLIAILKEVLQEREAARLTSDVEELVSI
jgi:hypothetical protein